jgi:hypothetical protein
MTETRKYVKREKPIFYNTKCKCKLLKRDLMHKQGFPKRCPEHGGEVVSAERECLDCEIILKLNDKGKGAFRCDKHKKEAAKKSKKGCTKRSNQKNKAAGTREKYTAVEAQSKLDSFNVHPRGGYCLESKVCHLLKALECDGCKAFIPIIKGVDPERMGYFV